MSEQENIYDHPAVKELLAKIEDLTQQITAFMPQLDQVTAAYREAKDNKETFLKSVNQQLSQFDAEMRIADQMKRDIESKINAANSIKDQIHSQIMQTVDSLQVQEKMHEVEERWSKLMLESDFLWKTSIRPFQEVATRFVVDGFCDDLHGVLLADQMGLGKTLEADAAIDVIQSLPTYSDLIADKCPGIDVNDQSLYSVLWICPNSIKETTMRELRKWGRDDTIRLDSVPPNVRNNIVKLAHENGMTLVVAYEQLRDRKGQPLTPALFEYDWPVVVLDEAHKFKGDNTSTFERVEQLCERAGYVIPMTGTPIMNRPEEFWAILHMLTLKGKYQGRFQEKWRFINEYCSQWGNTTTFYGNASDRLIKNVSDLVIRRRKDEVLVDMPDKVREVRFVELGEQQRELYDQMRDRFLIWLDEQHNDALSATSILAQLTRLRQIALYPAGVKIKLLDDNGADTGNTLALECKESAKLDEAMDVLGELVDNKEKCLVFANYNEPLHELGRRIEEQLGVKVDYITGEGKYSNADYRANVQDKFNDPDSELRVVLGNIAAMGLGLNLQGACSNAIFLDLGWNPGVNEQAEDRLHRQGQKNAVTIHIIQCEDTVDGFIAKILEDKAAMIEGVVEREELRKMVHDGLI